MRASSLERQTLSLSLEQKNQILKSERTRNVQIESNRNATSQTSEMAITRTEIDRFQLF